MSPIKPRRKKYTDAQMIAALKETKGMIYLAAQTLGCDYNTIHRRAGASPKVKAAIDSYRAEVIDVAEVALMAAVQARQPWAIAFTLRTIGRGRGYVEKVQQEVTGPNGGPIVVKAFEYGAAVAEIAPGPGADSAPPFEGQGYFDGATLGQNDDGG